MLYVRLRCNFPAADEQFVGGIAACTHLTEFAVLFNEAAQEAPVNGTATGGARCAQRQLLFGSGLYLVFALLCENLPCWWS